MLILANSIHSGHRERMRKRFSETCGRGFDDHELLEMLLYYSVSRVNTNETAHRLLQCFGSFENILGASIEELTQVDGVGLTTAIMLKCIFEVHTRMLIEGRKNERYDTYEKIGEYFEKLFLHLDYETMIMLIFDKRQRIIRTANVSVGAGSERTVVDMKAIISATIAKGAHSVAFAHNHPSGRLESSAEDRAFTVRIMDMLKELNINFLEHYVITEEGYRGIKQDKFSWLGE